MSTTPYYITATLIDCEFLFDGVRRVWLALPENSTLTYQAGQYIYLTLADGEERPYSVANAPANNILELHIHYHSGGADFTHELFNELLNTRKIRLHGPAGHCYYHVPTQPRWVLLAGGTGLAPCKAIIEAAIAAQHPQFIHLYWGVRSPQHLYLHTQLTQWTQHHNWFTYTPVIFSTPEKHSAYRYGKVQEEMLKDYPQVQDLFVYTAGPAPMIFACQEYLLSHSLPADQFCSDYT